MDNDNDGLLTKKEVSNILGVSIVTLVTWAKSGKLIPDKTHTDNRGNFYFYDPDKIKQLKKTRKIKKTNDTTRTERIQNREDKLEARKVEIQDRIDESDNGIDLLASELCIITGIPSSVFYNLVVNGYIKAIGKRGKRDLYDSNLTSTLSSQVNGTRFSTHTPQWVIDMRKERDLTPVQSETTRDKFVWQKPVFAPVNET